jgi:SpoVK/Ycf46/Vps4 family AAA+-type ATPase
MATAEQIKMLVKSHFDNDEQKFRTVCLQIAAYEASLGHTNIARQLKDICMKGSLQQKKVIPFNNKIDSLYGTVPNVRLVDLIVSDEIHERIYRILNEYKNRTKLQRYGMTNRKKILIEGNPGTGKTLTASIIASELKLSLYTVQMDKMVTKYMGETSVRLRQIFDFIEETPAVYLFDEFDAIGADRSLDNEVGEMRRVLNSFLQFLEQDNSDSIIIAATNNFQILDKALFRRFDDVLHYTYPSEKEIKALFISKLGCYQNDFRVSEKLIDKSRNLSQAEISSVCSDAIKMSILSNRKIVENDILHLINERVSNSFKEA